MRSTPDGVQVADVPDEGEGVRVSVRACGVCGSDLRLVAMGPMAATLGHEFAGVLDDGTAVAVRPTVPCGACRSCGAGRPQLCQAGMSRMHGVTLDGGMADAVWVDPSCVVPLAGGVGPQDAALVEPLAVAAHAVDRVGVEAGMQVLVVGAGPIGLCVIAAARARGARVDVDAHRRSRQEVAERLGGRVGAGGRYEIVIDAAGTASSAAAAVRHAAPGGTVGVVGTWWDPVQLDATWLMKEVALVPAFVYSPSGFAAAAALLAEVPDLAGALVTHRMGLADAREAFRIAGDRESGAIKVVLHP